MLPFLPQAVVFDMDGLLIESERLYRDSFLADRPLTLDLVSAAASEDF